MSTSPLQDDEKNDNDTYHTDEEFLYDSSEFESESDPESESDIDGDAQLKKMYMDMFNNLDSSSINGISSLLKKTFG